MTRAQRIALRRYDRRRYPLLRITVVLPTEPFDMYQDVNPSESIVFVRGNAGMLCS